jgi:hypothetical protein
MDIKSRVLLRRQKIQRHTNIFELSDEERRQIKIEEIVVELEDLIIESNSRNKFDCWVYCFEEMWNEVIDIISENFEGIAFIYFSNKLKGVWGPNHNF